MRWQRFCTWVLRRALWLALGTALPVPVLACEGAQLVRLRQPVALSAQEKSAFQALAPLRVLALDAPPMARYDAASKTYSGIGVDIWCFIASELGLRYAIVPG
ncbi:MAG: GGDEF domain-containing protein, partial [Proteobacteria bacterium]|nr:GGDEF domain-containing protein [Pseudomonadota bacterium]